MMKIVNTLKCKRRACAVILLNLHCVDLTSRYSQWSGSQQVLVRLNHVTTCTCILLQLSPQEMSSLQSTSVKYSIMSLRG